MLTASYVLEFNYYLGLLVLHMPSKPLISEPDSPPAKHGAFFQFFEFFHSDFCKSLTKYGRIKLRGPLFDSEQK